MTLIKTTNEYIADSEDEAIEAIKEFKDNALVEGYTPTKSGYTARTKTSKGEVIDTWWVVVLQKKFEYQR